MKKGIFFIITFLFISVNIMILAGCGSSGSGEAENNEKPYDHNTTLAELSINTDIGSRVSPTGEVVSEEYNPTLKSVTQLAKRSEIFFAGATGQSNTDDVLWTTPDMVHAALDWEDGATNFTATNLSDEDSWLKLPKAMASGDIDGDGTDEILIAYLKASDQVAYDKELMLRVIKKSDDAYTIIAERSVAAYLDSAITEYKDAYWWMNNFSAVCGDVDGNGQNETLIAFNRSVFLIGDDDTDFNLLKKISYTTSASTHYALLKISAGDLDNNGTDEFVVVENRNQKTNSLYGTAVYHIYSDADLKELDSKTISVTKDAATVTLHSSNCAVGDLDGDGLNEVLFIGEPENNANYYMMILDQQWDENTERFKFSFVEDYESFPGRSIYYITPVCAIADFDGDGKKEFIGYRYMYENFSETGGAFTRKSGVPDIYNPTNEALLESMWDCNLAVGDIDGDTKADITYITREWYHLYCMGFNAAGEWVRKGTGNITNTGVNYPAVTMGDYDGDSIAVEFVESEVLFSDPHPIAVLSSNPFWSDVDMGGESSFGTTTGSKVETEKSMGLSVGFSVGYESEGLFGLWSAKVKTSFESSFDWTATQAVSIEESYTYTTENEDKVIFTTIPYDVYYYRVIQAPDPEMVDTVITVNLPRKPTTLPMEINYYNAHNGVAPDIDRTLLDHTIGSPLSYPTSSEADDLITAGGGQGIKSTSMLTVGQGSGVTSINMSKTEANGSGSAFDFSVTIEGEVGAGGFTAGSSAGFHYGESYTVTTQEGMLYGGVVGNIPEADWSTDRSFTWGLFSYQASLGNEKFVVVDYYTESL